MGDDAGAWRRIWAAAEAEDPKNTLTWLATKLGYSVQRVQNWSVRGVPAREYPAIAAVFGESIEWVAGLSERRGEKQEQGLAFRDLNAFETQLVTFFRQLDPDSQHEVLTALNDMVPKDRRASRADPFAARQMRGESRLGELLDIPEPKRRAK